jgi:hypothetical protein
MGNSSDEASYSKLRRILDKRGLKSHGGRRAKITEISENRGIKDA